MATIRSIGFAGVDPTIMGAGPVPASRKALEKAGLKAKDIDYWEINEAFCIVVLYCIKELGIDPDRINIMGRGHSHRPSIGSHGNSSGRYAGSNPKGGRWPLWTSKRMLWWRTGRGHDY
jgi:acetyl-CoA acyltransferase